MKSILINTLNEISPLTQQDKDSIANLIFKKKLQPGEFWFQQGQAVDNIAFVTSGYLRKYFITNENERTDYFYFENDLTGDLPSILAREPCQSYNVAMEPTDLLVFSYGELNALAENSRNVDRLLRRFAELAFVRYYKRATAFLLQSPKERYYELMEVQPEVLNRATQYHIASYLGITPQHLSRLRAAK